MIDQELICKVNLLKDQHPCSTTSLDRTPYHNKVVGGAPNSWHLSGQAIDLIFDRPESLLPAAVYARALGFGGIEVDFRNLHLHLDLRTTVWHVAYNGLGEKFSLEQYLTLSPIPV